MRNNRFFVLLHVIIYLVIVVSSSFINKNDNHTSTNDTEDSWYRTRVILRNVQNTFDTDKKVNRNLDLTFGRSMQEWLYTHDAVVNSSCVFSKAFGRLCYIYHCDKGKTLYCELKLRTGPCPESLKIYENSFQCRDIKINRAKGKVHVCKLGGMVRSLGERSKLRNGKNACVYRDVMTLNGSMVEELIKRVDGEPWVPRRRRHFRRESEDTIEIEQEEDEHLETDEDEEDAKKDSTSKNSEENNETDNSDKSTTEGNNEDDNDISNSKSTTATSNVDDEDPTEETMETRREDDVSGEPETSDDDVETTSDDVTDESVTSPEEEKMTTKTEEEEATIISDKAEMTSPEETEEMVTTSKANNVMTTPKGRNEGDKRVDDGSFKERKKIYDVLNKLFREHGDFFTFQIESQIEKRIKEGKMSELLRMKMKALTKNKSMRSEAVVGNLKNEIRGLLYCSKTKTMVRDMLTNLGRDLKVGKNGKLFR